MSTSAPNRQSAKPASAFYAFLFLSAIALALLGTALILGTEPRLAIERGVDGIVRATGSNHFAGYRFFSKTIEDVKEVVMDNAVRDKRHDSEKVNRKRRKDLHLDILAADGSRLSWDRESDLSVIAQFLRSVEPSLFLADRPPGWRMGLAWFCVVFGGLTFVGAIQSFFPKKGTTVNSSRSFGTSEPPPPYTKV